MFEAIQDLENMFAYLDDSLAARHSEMHLCDLFDRLMKHNAIINASKC